MLFLSSKQESEPNLLLENDSVFTKQNKELEENFSSENMQVKITIRFHKFVYVNFVFLFIDKWQCSNCFESVFN